MLCLNENILKTGFSFSSSNIYKIPEGNSLKDYKEYISQLPHQICVEDLHLTSSIAQKKKAIEGIEFIKCPAKINLNK